MNEVQVHLALNHFPIVGFLLFVPLFLYAILRQKHEVLKVSLIAFFILGLVALVVHNSGEGAEEVLEDLGASHKLIHEHEEAGEKAFLLAMITGFLSVFVLAMRWYYEGWKRWVYIGILALGLVTIGLTSFAGSTGGKIRHSEELEKGAQEHQEHEHAEDEHDDD
ncbi:MAG: hypothetical protein EP332_10375 [Bacteroidetes bacterium]|nr:MAG: hypothetical protein EP332_10375 [Bacteroidota bacterium]